MQLLELQIGEQRIETRIFEMFPLNYNFIMSFFTTILSYLIVMIQYEMGV